MSTERVYLAGPMTGLPWFNFHTFDSARDWLVRMGFVVVSPADLDREVGFDALLLPGPFAPAAGFDLRAAARRDLEALCGCSGIVLLPGWYQSAGARAELGVARWLGLRVWVLEEDAVAPVWVMHPWTGGEDFNAEGAEGAEVRRGGGRQEEAYMDGQDKRGSDGTAGGAAGGVDQGRERAGEFHHEGTKGTKGSACGVGTED